MKGRYLSIGKNVQGRLSCAVSRSMFRYFPTNYVYILSIASATGFVPMFENGGADSRFLGVMVRLIPTYVEHR